MTEEKQEEEIKEELEEELEEEIQEYLQEENKIKTIPIKTAAIDKYYLLNKYMITNIIMIIALFLTLFMTTFSKWAGGAIAAIMCGTNAVIAIKNKNEMERLKQEYDLKIK
jgi:Pyruvate/2-oxoacid:ferredoxin oxidoreductase gamma subunit